MVAGRAHGAHEVGRRYELGLDDAARRQGAHYTPPAVAAMLVGATLARWGERRPVVCDPCCGGGAFLIAAADALVAQGCSPEEVVARRIVGVDVDPGAVEAATDALRVWAAAHGVTGVEPLVLHGDALDPATTDRIGALVGNVDVVVGNPPFRNQLEGDRARTPDERRWLTERFGDAVRGYTDAAALFLLAALDLVDPGGVVTQILPRSVLVARDAERVRHAVLDRGDLLAAWIPGVPVFEASVDVCALTMRLTSDPAGGRAERQGIVVVTAGDDGTASRASVPLAALSDAPTWSPLWASAHEIPASPARPRASVDDLATTTAGFRDQYYGLVDHLADVRPEHGARLVTTAHVDPGRTRWGEREVTVARRRFTTPWVDLAAVTSDPEDASLAGWLDRVRVPKVLVATQTRVIEATVDADGGDVPLVPLIVVLPRDDVDPWALAAALSAPAATVWALHRFGGAGWSSTALKLAAGQVAQVPLPVDRGAWDEGTAMLRSTPDWRRFGAVMQRSWGASDDGLVEWWWRRHPANPDRRRNVRTSAPGSLH